MKTMNLVKISVVVPVYNSEKYITNAIHSILFQDFEDFELLLVDDGSTDNSGRICDEFASADKRVRVFHIQNGGMCHARNYALRRAKGAYIAFCDDDDEYLPKLLSDNYSLAIEHNADCVRFGRYLELYRPGTKDPELSHGTPSISTSLSSKKEIDRHLDLLFFGADGVWNGLYRRGFLIGNNIQFNEELRRGCEDKLFNLDVFDHAEKIYLNANRYYVWRRRVGHSSSFKLDNNYYLGFALWVHRLYQFFENRVTSENMNYIANAHATPFREMVGAFTTLDNITIQDCYEFCRKTNVIYEGYWDIHDDSVTIVQGKVLDLIMRSQYSIPVSSLMAWHYWKKLNWKTRRIRNRFTKCKRQNVGI